MPMVWPPGMPNTNLTPSALRTFTTAWPALIIVIAFIPVLGHGARLQDASTVLLLAWVRVHQRTASLIKRTKRLLSRHRGDHVVNVPFALGFSGLLNLQQ